MKGWILVLALALSACTNQHGTPGDPVAGESLVENVSPGCGLCHTLEGADFVGTSAPNLDVLQPGYQRVLDAVREGPGLMPSYREQLSERQMHDLAAYISREASS
jgi:cytochrome c6